MLKSNSVLQINSFFISNEDFEPTKALIKFHHQIVCIFVPKKKEIVYIVI
jgi:hypothetical protein